MKVRRMQDSEIFKAPLPQTLVRAIEIARQAQTGEVDDFLEHSFRQQIKNSLEVTGMTLERYCQVVDRGLGFTSL